MWGSWRIISPLSEKVCGTRPPCPPPNCAHGYGAIKLNGTENGPAAQLGQFPPKFLKDMFIFRYNNLQSFYLPTKILQQQITIIFLPENISWLWP